jgi:hypothetical protein
MRAKTILPAVLPTLALGGAALLLAPTSELRAFSKIGGSLSTEQRDVRLFNNFLDSTANNNVAMDAQFPGYDGAELAIWKGVIEWSSDPHGDGTGDPLQPVLGNGNANFDPLWCGNANNVGGQNNNIASSLSSCGGGGTLAFTETPISDGWRIRFCDEWTWDDGPSTIGGRWDIQGVMAHEYGHALGLGHTGVSGATMFPSGSPGQTSIRSIHADDIAGIQCVYAVAAAAKPCIVATVADTGTNTLTIYGTDFGATGNEVWFTSEAATATSADPIVRVTGVSSTAGNTVITVTIPAAAGPGDVIVNGPGTGNSTVSNAFPTDLVGTFGDVPGAHPDLTSVTPSTIDALIPGTAETITLSGTDLDLTTAVLLDGVGIDPSRYTIVNATTITLDMPQASTLGAHDLGVTDGVVTDQFAVTIVAPAAPRYQLGSGDALNVVDRDDGLPFIMSGAVGSSHVVCSSRSNLPSSNAYASLDIGNNFTELVVGNTFVIPASGWLEIVVPTGSLPNPGPAGKTFYSQTFELAFPIPFDVSNLQSMRLVQ